MGGQILNEGEEGSQQKEWEGDESITAIGPGSIACPCGSGLTRTLIKIPLGRIRLTPKNEGYMGVA